MVNMFKRCTAKKLLSGNETSPCWYCKMPTQYSLVEKDGSEIWCCEHCIVKIGKIKRFKRLLHKYSTSPKKEKKVDSLRVKIEKQAMFRGGIE